MGPRVIGPVWSAQTGPQLEAIMATWADELFYGGAAGGGKSDFLLGDFLQDVTTYGRNWIGILFRRTYNELEELIRRSREIYPGSGADWHEQQKMWTWPNGATLRMRYIERDNDATRYQGHQYCVAVGTPILMGDGAFRSIERIVVGDLVQTLVGPRQVKTVIQPYRAPCALATVFDASGDYVGEQVQPLWHPVLSANGADWFSYSGGGQSADIEPSQRRPSGLRPHVLSFPVMLCRQSRRSAEPRGHISTQRSTGHHAFCRLMQQLLVNREQTTSYAVDLWRRLARFLQVLDHFGPVASNGLAYAPCVSQTASNSRSCCPIGIHSRDERVRAWRESGLRALPLPSDAVGRLRERPPGVSDTIPTHNHQAQPRWVHPYTGEVRHLSEAADAGHVDLEPCGVAWV